MVSQNSRRASSNAAGKIYIKGLINMIDLRVEAWSEEDVYGQQAVSSYRVLNLSAPIQVFMQYNT
jgi:hypothetical protein